MPSPKPQTSILKVAICVILYFQTLKSLVYKQRFRNWHWHSVSSSSIFPFQVKSSVRTWIGCYFAAPLLSVSPSSLGTAGRRLSVSWTLGKPRAAGSTGESSRVSDPATETQATSTLAAHPPLLPLLAPVSHIMSCHIIGKFIKIKVRYRMEFNWSTCFSHQSNWEDNSILGLLQGTAVRHFDILFESPLLYICKPKLYLELFFASSPLAHGTTRPMWIGQWKLAPKTGSLYSASTSRAVATEEVISIPCILNFSKCQPCIYSMLAAYTCNDNQPFVVNDVGYGYAAASLSGQGERDTCCSCYELQFTSGSVNGKKMIVQVTNTGADLGVCWSNTKLIL